MNWILMTAATGLLLMGAPSQANGIAADKPPSSSHRFQMFSAQVEYKQDDGSDIPEHEVFLLDSETGRVWRYQANAEMETQPGTRQLIPEHFIAVPIDR